MPVDDGMVLIKLELQGMRQATISWDEAVEGFKRNAVKTIEAVMR